MALPLYKDNDGKVYEVIESSQIDLQKLEVEITEAEFALERLKDKRAQYLELIEAPASAENSVHPDVAEPVTAEEPVATEPPVAEVVSAPVAEVASAPVAEAVPANVETPAAEAPQRPAEPETAPEGLVIH